MMLIKHLTKDESGSTMTFAVMITAIVITLITAVVMMATMMTTQSHAAARTIAADSLAQSGSSYLEHYINAEVPSGTDVSTIPTTFLDDLNDTVISPGDRATHQFRFSDIQVIHDVIDDAPAVSVYYTVESIVSTSNETLGDATFDERSGIRGEVKDVIVITQ